MKPFDMDVALPAVIFLLCSIPLYWLIIVLIELKVLSCRRRANINRSQIVEKHNDNLESLIKKNNLGDDDVQQEVDRVKGASKDIPVRLANCTKVYGETKAVDNVSFGLDYGECFALLGVSGAGKTTCFKCLTGVVKPDGGEVSINGFDITRESEFKSAR